MSDAPFRLQSSQQSVWLMTVPTHTFAPQTMLVLAVAQVVDPTYFQMAFQTPPLAAADGTVFVHDYFNHFTSTLFLGQDLRLFVYEAMFFLTIDCLAIQNVSRPGWLRVALEVCSLLFGQRASTRFYLLA